MATWGEVHEFLNQNYESDMGMGILAGLNLLQLLFQTTMALKSFWL
jgi:hypothetical protein